MTIQEAIKSGKPFKRPSWATWVEPNHTAIFHKISAKDRSSRYQMKFATKQDLLADDWEIKDFKAAMLVAVKAVMKAHGKDSTHNLYAFHSDDRYLFRVQSRAFERKVEERRRERDRARRCKYPKAVCLCANCIYALKRRDR